MRTPHTQVLYSAATHTHTHNCAFCQDWKKKKDTLLLLLLEGIMCINNFIKGIISCNSSKEKAFSSYLVPLVRLDAYETFSLVSCAKAFPYPLRNSVAADGSLGAFGLAHSSFKIK